MIGAANNEREKLVQELSKHDRNEFLLPLMGLLEIPDSSLQGDHQLELVANKLQKLIDGYGSQNLSDADAVGKLCSFLTERSLPNHPLIDQVERMLYNVFPKVLPAPAQTPPTSTRLSNLAESHKCLCTACLTIPGVQQIACLSCNNLFHAECMRPKKLNFECPYCILAKIDPLNRIVQTLFVACLHKLHDYYFEFPPPVKIADDEQLEVRCVRLDGVNNNVQNWPDIGKLTLNNAELMEFVPLPVNMGLKKRRDRTATITASSLKPTNLLEISTELPGYPREQFRIADKPHFLGVYKVRRLDSRQLFNMVKECYAPSEHSNHLLRLALDGEGQTTLIPLLCPISNCRMEVPARGRFCQHYQCFDLVTFIRYNYSGRRWECPICSRHIYDLTVDEQLKEIIGKSEGAVAVRFKEQGGKLLYQVEDNPRGFIFPQPKGQMRTEAGVELVLNSEDYTESYQQQPQLLGTHEDVIKKSPMPDQLRKWVLSTNEHPSPNNNCQHDQWQNRKHQPTDFALQRLLQALRDTQQIDNQLESGSMPERTKQSLPSAEAIQQPQAHEQSFDQPAISHEVMQASYMHSNPEVITYKEAEQTAARAELQTVRVMNKHRFDRGRLLKPDERDLFVQLYCDIELFDLADESRTAERRTDCSC